MKVFVSVYPFSESSPKPMERLKSAGLSVTVSPFKRKMTSDELAKHCNNADILIAGTETIDERVFQANPNLKLIARVGIGLDGLDEAVCRAYGVLVTYTPDAPTVAVAEYTLGALLTLMRQLHLADQTLHAGNWTRFVGDQLLGKTVGIVGMGRCGKAVIQRLAGFGVMVLAHDPVFDSDFASHHHVRQVSLEALLKESDVVSLHVPLTEDTMHMICDATLNLMKPGAYLINTSRGFVVDEAALVRALLSKKLSGAVLDVFQKEPYEGPLSACENAFLTCHMGSCSHEARGLMETGAAMEAVRFSKGDDPLQKAF